MPVYELVIRAAGGGHIALCLALHVLSRTLNLGLISTAPTIPAVDNLTGSITSAQTECQACCQCQSTDKAHEQSIDQFLSDTNLVDRDHNTEGPNCHACNRRQQVRVIEPCLRRGAAYQVAQSVRRQTRDHKDHDCDHQVRDP